MSKSMLRIPSILILLILPLLLMGGAATAGTGLEFDGNDHLTAADDPSLNPADAITIETWCYFPGPFSDLGNCPVLEKPYMNHQHPWYQYHLGVNTMTQEFLFDLALDGSRNLLRSPLDAFPFGEWFHVAATYDGATMRIFINGEQVSSRSASGIISTYERDVYLGRYGNFNTGIVGQLDDMRLWSVARTSEQINAGMCTPPKGDEAGLMAAWVFDEGSGLVAADRSPNQNDATFGDEGREPDWVPVEIPDCPELDLEVMIDVKPGSDDNPVGCEASDKKNVVPVALLTTDDFDALSVDHATVRFGPAGTPEAHANHHGPIRHEEDVDHDGDLDLVFHFMVGSSGIQCGDTSVELVGETWDGQAFVGSDMITTKPRVRKPGKEGDGLTISPNPFNPRTTVSFVLDHGSDVRITVHDIRGMLVARLADQSFGAGTHSVVWNGLDTRGRAAPSGQYFFMMDIDGSVEIRKAVLMK